MSLAPLEESLWRETVLQEKLKNPLFRSVHVHAKKDKDQGHSQRPFPQKVICYLFNMYSFVSFPLVGQLAQSRFCVMGSFVNSPCTHLSKCMEQMMELLLSFPIYTQS